MRVLKKTEEMDKIKKGFTFTILYFHNRDVNLYNNQRKTYKMSSQLKLLQYYSLQAIIKI